MYRFLDHASEAMIEVEAPSIEEVFRESAIALFETMTDTTALKPVEEFEVYLDSTQRDLLLIDWLNKLIYIHEVERVFLCSFDAHITKNEVFTLKALVSGERIRQNQERRSHVKSATYGMFEWNQNESGHRVRFVLDV